MLTEGSSPARAARTGPADVVTGSPVVTLTLVATAQPEPPLRALWQADANENEEPVPSQGPWDAVLRRKLGLSMEIIAPGSCFL